MSPQSTPAPSMSWSTAAEAGLDPCATSLEALGIEVSAEITVRCIVKDGNPEEAIAEGIAENHPCILVAGVKRASATPGPHGTAFSLLARSRVPVLCVPPERTSAKCKLEACACAETR